LAQEPFWPKRHFWLKSKVSYGTSLPCLPSLSVMGASRALITCRLANNTMVYINNEAISMQLLQIITSGGVLEKIPNLAADPLQIDAKPEITSQRKPELETTATTTIMIEEGLEKLRQQQKTTDENLACMAENLNSLQTTTEETMKYMKHSMQTTTEETKKDMKSTLDGMMETLNYMQTSTEESKEEMRSDLRESVTNVLMTMAESLKEMKAEAVERAVKLVQENQMVEMTKVEKLIEDVKEVTETILPQFVKNTTKNKDMCDNLADLVKALAQNQEKLQAAVTARTKQKSKG